MLIKTSGIVLRYVKYGDTSIIATLLTEAYGKMAFMVHGVRKNNAHIKLNCFEPLSFLSVEAYIKQGRDIQRLKEASSLMPQTQDFHPATQALKYCIAEILNKSIREESRNAELYDFIIKTIQDIKTEAVMKFLLEFLLKYSKIIGIEPLNNYSAQMCYFDLINGHFTGNIPEHPYYVANKTAELFSVLLTQIQEEKSLDIEYQNIKYFIPMLINYYRLHHIHIGEFKSYTVLQDILS